jgi:hypothetical protein
LIGNISTGAPVHNELVPCEAVLQDWRLSFGRPGPNAVRSFAHPGFVDEDDGSAFSRAVFFKAGQRFFFHRRMAASSRFLARPLGRWQEKFSPLSSRQTPDSEYRLPLIFSMILPGTLWRFSRDPYATLAVGRKLAFGNAFSSSWPPTPITNTP